MRSIIISRHHFHILRKIHFVKKRIFLIAKKGTMFKVPFMRHIKNTRVFSHESFKTNKVMEGIVCYILELI